MLLPWCICKKLLIFVCFQKLYWKLTVFQTRKVATVSTLAQENKETVWKLSSYRGQGVFPQSFFVCFQGETNLFEFLALGVSSTLTETTWRFFVFFLSPLYVEREKSIKFMRFCERCQSLVSGIKKTFTQRVTFIWATYFNGFTWQSKTSFTFHIFTVCANGSRVSTKIFLKLAICVNGTSRRFSQKNEKKLCWTAQNQGRKKKEIEVEETSPS